jgi:hypothetical protein
VMMFQITARAMEPIRGIPSPGRPTT